MATSPATAACTFLEPSGTPTYGFYDSVTVEWVANFVGDVALYCKQNASGLFVEGTPTTNAAGSSITIASFLGIGYVYQSDYFISSFPATCFFSVGTQAAGGDFIITKRAAATPATATVTVTYSSETVSTKTARSTTFPSATSSLGPSTSPAKHTHSSSLSSGSIAGIAIGAVAGVVLLALAGWFIMRRKRQQRRGIGGNPTTPAEAPSHPVVYPQEMEGVGPSPRDTTQAQSPYWKHDSPQQPHELSPDAIHELPGYPD